MLTALIRLARPKHWIKNGFVLLPIPFALADGARIDAIGFLGGLTGFCLVTSGVYTFNDIQDAEADRLNPAKRERPIASGQVPLATAWAQCALLLVVGLAFIVMTSSIPVLFLTLGYVLANFAYSLGAKHIPVLDVFILASGFLIRVLIGCALVFAAPSSWLLLCSSSLALFLAFAKRRADLAAGVSHEHRPALAGYSVPYLDQAMSICAGIALLTYALYCREGRFFVDGREMAGLGFVAFGILDYLRLAYVHNAGGNPVELALRSRSLQLCGIGWLVASAWSLGLL